MASSRFICQTSLCLFVVGLLTMTGCDPANMGAFRGVAEKFGAKVVSKSSDEELREMFRKTNDQCPIKMDAYTTLEEVRMIDDKNAEFKYKVNDNGRRLLQGLSKDQMRRNAVEHMKGNAMAVAVAERDLTIEHIYEDRFGGHILSYTINKDVLSGREPMGDQQGNPFAVKTVKAEPAEQVETTNADPVAADEPQAQPDAELPSMPESSPEPEDLLPQQYVPAKPSRDNPAGVQANPFFQ